MMNMKLKIVAVGCALAIATTSCKKDLDLRPTDTVGEEAAFNNVAALQKGLNTAYARYSVARADKSFASSITSDETKFGPDNGGFGQFGYRLQYNSDAGSGADVTVGFGIYYSMLDMVNRVLAVLPEVPATGTEAAQKSAITGQLLALRALGHFELLEAYSKRYDPADLLGIPVVTRSCLTCFPPRNSTAEVISRVEQDLVDAKALLPIPGATGYNDLALNQVSVTAIQARVALYKGEWQKAADYATSVITSGVKTLASGAAFNGIWTDANTNELLFRSRLENSTTLGGQWTSTNSNVIFSPSDKLTSSYATTDIRLNAYIGTNAGKRYVKKFSASSRGGSIVDVKNIRIAEMYLIRAEARAELNDLAGAASDINALRTARITGYTNISYSDKATAIAEILLERFKELAFEGFRFFDLKRRGLPLQRNASDVDSPLWQTLAVGDKRFVYPIPAGEILANPNMQQNPGY
jgi:starch-binding outer membrane protein, SusD/RagB family